MRLATNVAKHKSKIQSNPVISNPMQVTNVDIKNMHSLQYMNVLYCKGGMD